MNTTKFQHGDWTLFDALDALQAYDSGSFDSGVHDPDLREAVRRYFVGLSRRERKQVCSAFTRECRSNESGYTIEDVVTFSDWLSELMYGHGNGWVMNYSGNDGSFSWPVVPLDQLPNT